VAGESEREEAAGRRGEERGGLKGKGEKVVEDESLSNWMNHQIIPLKSNNCGNTSNDLVNENCVKFIFYKFCRRKFSHVNFKSLDGKFVM
jgi:hypothetical protein